jgi:hypothetical protein
MLIPPRIAALACWSTLGLLLACRSSSGGPAGSASTPCGDYFDAINANPCGTGPTLPDAETARLRSRFEQVCASYTTLPGSQITGEDIESCAAAIQAGGCAAEGTTPEVCNVLGTLPAGGACNENFQCQSGVCFQTATVGEAGPALDDCGKCQMVPGVGQSCTTNCAPGAACDTSMTPPTCVAVTQVAAGATCNGTTTVCGAGFYCDSGGTCAALLATGQACGSNGPCAPPATCLGQTCQAPGATGAACGLDSDCAAGLGCGVGSMTCGPVVWASAGQPCGDLTRCLVGSCNYPMCPSVIGDGQACSPDDASSTCDTFSQCTGGACVLDDSAACL